MKLKHAITLGVLLLAVSFIAYAIVQAPENTPPSVRTLRTNQEADAPDGEPRQFQSGWFVPPFDPRLDLFSGLDRFRVPVADRFDSVSYTHLTLPTILLV